MFLDDGFIHSHNVIVVGFLSVSVLINSISVMSKESRISLLHATMKYQKLLLILGLLCGVAHARLKQIVYLSHSNETSMSHEELQKIVMTCRQRNERLEITGLLLYKEGNFCQILDGPEESINIVMESIRNDIRHGGIVVILERFVEERSFRYWNIAFRNLAYTSRMNDWADSQAILTSTEEQLLFDRTMEAVHEPPQKVSRVIARMISLYQRILLHMEPHERLDNQWERINRIGQRQESD